MCTAAGQPSLFAIELTLVNIFPQVTLSFFNYLNILMVAPKC